MVPDRTTNTRFPIIYLATLQSETVGTFVREVNKTLRDYSLRRLTPTPKVVYTVREGGELTDGTVA